MSETMSSDTPTPPGATPGESTATQASPAPSWRSGALAHSVGVDDPPDTEPAGRRGEL